MSGLWLDAAAERSPGSEAVRSGRERVDYKELARRCDVLATELTRAGFQTGDLIATLVPAGIPAIVLFHAARACELIFVPLNSRLSEAEQRFQLGDAGVRAVVTAGHEHMERAGLLAADMGIGLVHVDAEASSSVRLALPDVDASTRDPLLRKGACAVLYTSGTSGRPKGAVLTADALESSARAAASHLGSDETDRWLACMPLFHIAGISILVRAVLVGGCVVVHERFDAAAVSRSLDADGITQISLVADTLRRVLDVREEQRAPSSLRCVLVGGGPAPSALLNRARSLGYPIAPTYGLTEAASQVATELPHAEGTADGAGPTPVPGTRLRIVDQAGAEVVVGEAGEICVQGPSLMRGYLGRPDDTARALQGGWLHTGDIGALDENGALRVLDRRDDLIVSGGENVYPAEIEAVLASHPAIVEAGVIGQPDDRFGARPVAFVVSSATEGPTGDVLAEYCRGSLAGYKVPVSYYAVAALPRNASGKLLRRDLRKNLADRRE